MNFLKTADFLPDEIAAFVWDSSKIGKIEEGDIDMMKLPEKCTKHNKKYEYYLVIDKVMGLCKGGTKGYKIKDVGVGLKVERCEISFKSLGVKTYENNIRTVEIG
jgi:hypothetical protein